MFLEKLQKEGFRYLIHSQQELSRSVYNTYMPCKSYTVNKSCPGLYNTYMPCKSYTVN